MAEPLVEEVFIRCDPTTAFDLLADLRNEARWNKSVSVAELRGEEPIRQGSKFLTVYRGMKNDSTIVEFNRPERLVVATASDRMDIDTACVFTAANGGTKVVVSTDAHPKGVTSVLSPLLRWFLRREVAKKYATIKQACESQSDPSS
jgi:uncharacterized membrane protein